MKQVILFIILFCSASLAYGQIEHVPVSNPVYYFLEHAETHGLLEHFSLSQLPLQKQEIVKALEAIRAAEVKLPPDDLKTLTRYEKEFGIAPDETAVVIYSDTDDKQVLSHRMFGDYKKLIYKYDDSVNNCSIMPLGSIDFMYGQYADSTTNVTMGNLGIRLSGTLSGHVGYYLQATNGVVASGEKELALSEVKALQQNVKFADLDSDFDFSESHVRFDWDWFYISAGRETRLLGAGVDQRLFSSANAPARDEVAMGARFQSFEYRFSHGSLLALENAEHNVGFNANIPSKYLIMHRFAARPTWGEIAFWEGLIYSKRGIDMAYITPLSFFKSLEHALRDRDNSMMGGDITIRPIDGLQIKGSYFLDDIKFGEIGNKYWSNKSAWNIGVLAALPFSADIGVEFSRVEPYNFTHFDSVNSYTNDEMLIGTSLLPNSDELAFVLRWWWGGRYPILLRIANARHGDNYIDNEGNLVNVGGDPLQTRRPEDPLYGVTFLDGHRTDVFSVRLQAGFEIVRGFNLHGIYQFRSVNGDQANIFRIMFRYGDF